MATGKKNVDQIVLLALAAGGTPAAAAQQAKCSERTVRRRLLDPAFRARVEEARSKMVSDAVGKLASLGVAAADTLRQLLAVGTERVQLGAARSVLELMLRGIEVHELARQVQELKSRFDTIDKSRLRVLS
jgi:hypothetical protein